tara:strand:+ start:58 stop:786 length:729 start_codon:yes stop_codon:yes gene_type:complete
MAISIDTVYQKVLAIANKEQRGYVTPQEFNLFANQAQLTIFEQYFYDIDKALEIHGNSTEYSDRISELHEKIAPFEKYNVDMSAVSGSLMTLPTSTTVYKLGTVFYNDSTKSIKVERIDANQAELMQQTALYASTQSRPVYVRRSATQLQFYPSSASPAYATSTVNCNYIAKPTKPNWTYVVVNNQALFNSTASDAQDFQLHASEETQLVNKILELAGIVLNKPGLVQIAANEDNELMVKKQ